MDQIEIYFSILQRTVLTPNDLTDLDALAQRVLAFQARYNATATPFCARGAPNQRITRSP